MVSRFTGDPHSDALILGNVVRRIAREHRVSEHAARIWLEHALHFLGEAAAADAPISPPREADDAWHQFILHTRDYEAYCLERFGRFIHHDPYEDHRAGLRFGRRRRRKALGGGGGGGATGGVCGSGGSDGGSDGGGGGCGGGGCGGGG